MKHPKISPFSIRKPIQEVVGSYYEKLFNMDHPFSLQLQEVLNQVPYSITRDLSDSLFKPYSK